MFVRVTFQGFCHLPPLVSSGLPSLCDRVCRPAVREHQSEQIYLYDTCIGFYCLGSLGWSLERGSDDLRSKLSPEVMAEDIPELQTALRDLDQELEVRELSEQYAFTNWVFF